MKGGISDHIIRAFSLLPNSPNSIVFQWACQWREIQFAYAIQESEIMPFGDNCVYIGKEKQFPTLNRRKACRSSQSRENDNCESSPVSIRASRVVLSSFSLSSHIFCVLSGSNEAWPDEERKEGDVLMGWLFSLFPCSFSLCKPHLVGIQAFSFLSLMGSIPHVKLRFRLLHCSQRKGKVVTNQGNGVRE